MSTSPIDGGSDRSKLPENPPTEESTGSGYSFSGQTFEENDLPFPIDHIAEIALAESAVPPAVDVSASINDHRNSVTKDKEDSPWIKNERIKTCKCESCDERVQGISHQCRYCRRHFCAVCLDPQSNRTSWAKVVAKDNFENGCWCKRFPSNMNPKLRHLQTPPVQRPERATRVRQRKEPQKSKKVAKTSLVAKKGSANADASSDIDTAVTTMSALAMCNGADSEYEGTQDINPTSMTGKGPKSCREHEFFVMASSDDDVFDENIKRRKTTAQIQAKQANPMHLRGGRTVIVGAGVVGLFVARELALRVREANIDHHITVVEICDDHCELASGNCAGFLTRSGIPDEWSDIAQMASEAWQEILLSREDRERIAFNARSLFKVAANGDVNRDRVPSWLQVRPGTSLLEDFGALGRINPTALAAWLYEQCELYDVRFRFNHTVSGLVYGKYGRLTNIYIKNVKNVDKPAEEIPCQNLVLAAGPYTTGIFYDLFEASASGLGNIVQSAHWFSVPLKQSTASDHIGLRLLDAAEHKRALEQEIVMVGRGEEKDVRVAGFHDRHTDVHLDPRSARARGKGKTNPIRFVAANLLQVAEVDVTNVEHLCRIGRAEMSTGTGGRPYIDRMPATAAGKSCEDQNTASKSVWLCYGFSKHGTFLAPGAARILVAKMLHG